MMDIVMGYVPVIHRGYRNFFNQHPGATLFIFGSEILEEYPQLIKNLPALDPVEIAVSAQALISEGYLKLAGAQVMTFDTVGFFQSGKTVIYMPDEDVSR